MFILYEHVRIHYASNNHMRPWILATVLALIHTIPYEFMYNLPLLLSPSHLNYANVYRLQCISIKAYARSLIFPWHGVPSRPALYYPWFIQDMLYPHSDSNHQNLGLNQLLWTMVYFSSRSNHTIIFDNNIIACVSIYWDKYFILYFTGIHRRYRNLNKLY